MATLNGTILNTDGSAPNPWESSRRACPMPGPVPVTRAGDTTPRLAASHIYFWPLQTPYVDGAAIVTSGPVRARISWETDAGDPAPGSFTVTLNQGVYGCEVGGDEFQITIPSDIGVFELQNVITSTMNFLPTASNVYQGNFPATAADFVLPANAVGVIGAPVATGWTQVVQGPGKYQIEAAVMVLGTSRGNGQQDNETYTLYLQDTTHNVLVGQQVSVENIFTGTQGQIILRGTVTIAGASQVLLEVYAAGNPTADDPTPAPLSVGTIIMEQSSMSITRLQ